MKIYKVLNNNAALIKEDDQENRDGTGNRFSKKKNDLIPMNKVEKIFVVRDENEKFKQILQTLPEEHIEIAEDIISYAEGEPRGAAERSHSYRAFRPFVLCDRKDSKWAACAE